MNARVTRTDDVRGIHPFDVFRHELTIKVPVAVSVRPCRTRGGLHLDDT